MSGNERLKEIAMSLNDADTYLCTKIERDFISKIGAGCSAPVACNAVKDGENIVFRTMIGFSNGTNIMSRRVVKNITESENLGVEVAQDMIGNGALKLLEDAQDVAFKDERPQRL